MGAVVGNNDPVALALMKMLGCPKNVRSITYRASVGEVSVVTIEYFPESGVDSSRDLAPIVKKFRLEPIEAWPFPEVESHPIMDRAELQRRQDALAAEGREIK